MAEHKLSGNDMLLMISRDNITFNQVVCLDSSTFDAETTEIDASSQCGPDTLPGNQKNTLSFEGKGLFDPSSGKVSVDELQDLWINKNRIYWKLTPAVPVTGDVIKLGQGFISKLSEAYAVDSAGTFSGGIGIYGIYTKTTATS